MQAIRPLWGGYVIKMARKRFVTEIFPRHGNRLSKLYKYAMRFGTKLAQT